MQIELIAVPYDSALRDARMGAGPRRLLEGGLAGRLAAAGHAVTTHWVEAGASALPAEIAGAFALARSIAARVREAVGRGAFPLVLAGNCNAALGTVAGLSLGRPGVFWLDAHGDFNTPDTTSSGFLDGMALATLTGRCWGRLAATIPGFRPVPERDVVLLGARDLDAPEAEQLDRSSVRFLNPAAVRRGLQPTLATLPPVLEGAYLHLDLDVLDPAEGRANGYAAPGGLRLDEVRAALRQIGARLPVRGATLAAYDPACDPEGRIAAAALSLAEEIARLAATGGPRRLAPQPAT